MTVQEFLTMLESDGKGPLSDREALTLLVQRAAEGLSQPFLDACFHAKFLVRSQEVMRRIGRGAEGFDLMAAEFQAGVERTTTLLRTVVKEAPAESRDRFVREYLQTDRGSFSRFLSLCNDLTRIKNWEVDGRPLPFLPSMSSVTLSSPTASISRADTMKDLLRASRLALLLFVLLLIFEGPVSILGWITAFIIMGLFVVIEYTAARQQNEQGA
ncbi:MAG: hypothetical protein MUE68_13260 [Bacteroidetes bacterium]|jgi:hypothetical protein|nr:hypothetical protein [Bacteroidota bacterium]